MSEIDLMLDEENELTFQLSIEGSRPATASCRLLLNNENMSLVFEADRRDNDEVSVILPPLTHILKEGMYDMTLEVIIDDKYFQPLTLQGNFEKSVKVMAEAKVTTKRKKATPKVSLVNVKSKPKSVRRQKVTENKKPTKQTRRRNTVSDSDILNIIKAISSKK